MYTCMYVDIHRYLNDLLLNVVHESAMISGLYLQDTEPLPSGAGHRILRPQKLSRMPTVTLLLDTPSTTSDALIQCVRNSCTRVCCIVAEMCQQLSYFLSVKGSNKQTN